jgi:predicted dithiol-disulfide oxidoreductase (DUF899 family)
LSRFLDRFAPLSVLRDDDPPTRVGPQLAQQIGRSAFALEDGIVYHTYSAYPRGLAALWGMYQWLDLQAGFWYRRHDEYQA